MRNLQRDSRIAAASGHSARAAKIAAAVALPLLLLGGAAVVTHRSAGALAAIALVASALLFGLGGWVLVTERRLRAAREGQRLGRQALEAIPHAVFVLDGAGAGRPNLYVNAAYAVLTGYGAREAMADGFDARAIFAGADGGPVWDASGEHDSARVVVRRRDGTTLPAKLALRAVPRDDGGHYLVGTIEDVSAGERAADRRPPSASEPPASDVAPPGGATGTFLSWLAHELRSPLNACVMWLDVLALGPQSDKLPNAVEAIKRGLARQAKLVSDLSDAARVAAGGLEMHFERLDLPALIASGAGAWQLLAIGKQVKLEQRVELATAKVTGDAERLLQALGHLIENAINSTPPQGRVELRVYGAGGACVVEVQDTGPPLPDEDAAPLFAPLQRAPTSAKGRSGLGLGLAVAHHIAVRHGGSLTGSSQTSGARFVLTLPLAAAPAAPTAGP